MLARMDVLLAGFEAQNDWRAVFMRAYRLTTQRVGEAIGAGEFIDRAWMTRLDVQFAGYYFAALARWDSGQPPSEPWRIAFECTRYRRTNVLQDVGLGMNAHINHDLVLAIVDVLEPDDDLAVREKDHSHMNAVLARILNEVQRDVTLRYDPSLLLADFTLGRIDEDIAAFSIEVARDHVWDNVLSVMESTHPERERKRLGTHVGHLAEAILLPTQRLVAYRVANRLLRDSWHRFRRIVISERLDRAGTRSWPRA